MDETTLYVVIYYDGSYFDNQNHIVGIFDTEEAANKQCELFEKGHGLYEDNVGSSDKIWVEAWDLSKEPFEVGKDWPYA